MRLPRELRQACLDEANGPGLTLPNPGAWLTSRAASAPVAMRARARQGLSPPPRVPAAAANVPEPIKAWIKLQLGAMYENPSAEGTVQTYALGFTDRLLDRYKVHAL